MNNEELNLIIFIGLSIFIFFLFIFILKREKINEQKFAAFELSLEEAHKEIFLLKKELKNNDLSKKIETIEKIVESIVDDVRAIEERNLQNLEALKEQIRELYAEIKKSKMPEMNFISKSDEEKIKTLYNNGYTIEEISRELRIPAGEVELILKFSSF